MSNFKECGGVQPRKLRVLLADESQTVRHNLREELRRLNWVEIVEEASTSQEAISLLFRLRPDAVVVAASIVDEGGFEVLRCVNHACPNCASILTCRRRDPFVTEAGRLLGATGVYCVADHPAQLVKLLGSLWDERSRGALND
jgi:DNA-binding NarL/FixJ family response regulator